MDDVFCHWRSDHIGQIFRDVNYCNKNLIVWHKANYYSVLCHEFHELIYFSCHGIKHLQSSGDYLSNMSEFELIWSRRPHNISVYHVTFFRYFGLNKEKLTKVLIRHMENH